MKVKELLMALEATGKEKEVYISLRGGMNDYFSNDPSFYDEDLFVAGVRESENSVYICTEDRLVE